MAIPNSREPGDETIVQQASKQVADSRSEVLAAKVPNEGQLLQDGARLTWSWVRKEIPEHFRRQFVAEIRSGPYSFRRREFLAEAPKTRPCGPCADPDSVIQECRPQFNRPEYGPDLPNYCFTWFARWSQRVMFDPRIRDEAVALAEKKIDQKIF